ncbi:hypothetical protein [Massilia sp. NR 4-1]|uniref:hypothetical protein n=1 Tax=Massilia sp. NR 4-1 TaxID=1678028 RepID=UPI00067CC57C|nr:hypothetical protein [Massilia sp. NR 4-1]AKU22378.1 hypothetical protein ACZ75_13795 [Massilia sp. NR 4-1]
MSTVFETVPLHLGAEPGIPHLRNQNDCDAAKVLVEQLLTMVKGDDGHPLGGMLDVLLQSVNQFERQYYRFAETEAKDRLSFLMEMGRLSVDDLSGVADMAELKAVLEGSRPVSAQLAMRLGQFFRAKPELFLK